MKELLKDLKTLKAQFEACAEGSGKAMDILEQIYESSSNEGIDLNSLSKSHGWRSSTPAQRIDDIINYVTSVDNLVFTQGGFVEELEEQLYDIYGPEECYIHSEEKEGTVCLNLFGENDKHLNIKIRKGKPFEGVDVNDVQMAYSAGSSMHKFAHSIIVPVWLTPKNLADIIIEEYDQKV